MIIEVRPGRAATEGVDVVGVPVQPGDDGPLLAVDGRRMESTMGLTGDPDSAWCHRHGFSGKLGQVAWWPGPSSPKSDSDGGLPFELVLVGMGDADEATGDRGLESLRRAVAAFVRAASHAEGAAFLLPEAPPTGAASVVDRAGAAAEGGMLAAYQYDAYRTAEPSSQLARLVLVPEDGDAAAAEEGVRRGARIAESVALARDLVNEPPSSLTPERFAAVFTERFASVPEVSIEVWDEERITAERLGGLLGVSRGSTQPPRLLRAEYRPAGSAAEDLPHIALVGKGITFDSGGLSLKTASGMETMKTDMSGAAVVLCCPRRGRRPRRSHADHRHRAVDREHAGRLGHQTGRRAHHPQRQDHRGAQHRRRRSPGAVRWPDPGRRGGARCHRRPGHADRGRGGGPGQGHRQSVRDGPELLEEVRQAGEKAGEPSWPMPLPDDYRSHIDSEVADMRNIGRSGQAGSIAAAMLLREFVGSIPWAHIDMAGPARADEAVRYLSKGGTGFGVRTLVNLVTSEDVSRRLARRREE